VSTVEKIALAIVGVAMITTLILPKRQTVGVIGAVDKLNTNALAVATGQTQAVRK
jgi:hypothetical protein